MSDAERRSEPSVMSAPGSQPPSMEDNLAVNDEEGGPPDVPLSAPPASIPSSAPPFPNAAKPSSTMEAATEGKAVSVASNGCRSAASSPAEASPAKPAETTTLDDAAQTSPATSHMASASDSLEHTGTSFLSISESPPSLSLLPSSEFDSPESGTDHPKVLTFKGVSVTLENDSVWKKFYGYGTEMILSKPGRRMFPYCRYRLSGLDPSLKYSLVLSIVPWDQHRYRWNKNQWEVSGAAEHQFQGLIRMFPHHNSPCLGSEWMSNLVSFYKLKLTNNFQDRDKDHIILHSLHRYIPRLHVIPVPQDIGPTAGGPVVMGPESMTFTFPQTLFMAVTYYQNLRITQLKIHFNPFARGFKDYWLNSRSLRGQAAKETDATQVPSNPDETKETNKEEAVDLSNTSCSDSSPLTNVLETRLVPIMSNAACKDEPYTPCMQGRCALGELVLVEKSPPVVKKEEDDPVSITPASPSRRESETPAASPKASSETSASVTSTPETSPGHRRRKKFNRRWTHFYARRSKASPAAVHGSSPTASTQPETDDVEGLLFVSFTSKEALEFHVRDRPAANAPPHTPLFPSTAAQLKETMEIRAEPDDDDARIAGLESVLLNDLRVLKHRQVIHPVLQEVGLKLSSLDPTQPIDLQYLGVALPLPPPKCSDGSLLSARNKGLPFISRTGKTSDVTKIKGWKSKFMTSSEASSSSCEGLQKNLSAFCSNMLDEYLESEAQQITERAAAFSTHPEGSVTYQLPEKSCSYVKTLDSALKHRSAASGFPPKSGRPCPLSHKPPLYCALTSTPASPDGPANAWRAAAPSSSAFGQKPAASFIPRRRKVPRPFGLNKFQLRLWEAEMGTLNQGLSRTCLTADRLSVALSVLVTKQTEPGRTSKVLPKKPSLGSDCQEVHCRLGCVCPGEERLDRDPLHCRKPECMLHCSCSPLSAAEPPAAEGGSQQHISPASPVANMDHVVRPRPDSHTNTLWNRSAQDEDPEPLFIPKCSQNITEDIRVPPHTQPTKEEDKDPIYRYFESMMTCARVRGVSPRPPRQLRAQLPIDAVPEPNASRTQPKGKPDVQAENGRSARPAAAKEANSEKDIKKQIQIQSLCPWQKDRQLILQALISRLSQDRLSNRFHVGSYCINPIDKISMRKPSGTIISYRVQIGVRSKDSDDEDEDGFANGEEEEEQEEDRAEEPENFFGVTPFLSGVMPAGKLRVMRKSPECPEQGFVQVNGKCYKHAKLMLGSIGSLHPANRLAAFVTGRLKIPKVFLRSSQEADDTHQRTAFENLHRKAADSAVSPAIAARRISDLKTLTQPQGQSVQPDTLGKGSVASVQNPPVCSVASGQQHLGGPLQSGSSPSPISLTVSPSLKSPSFLEQSGTYSFRICPPSNQSAGAQKLPGVSLPGGFTLIQLPQRGAEGAARRPAPLGAAPPPPNRFRQLAASWLGAKTQDKIRSLLNGRSEPGAAAASETIGDEPKPPEGDEASSPPESHPSSQSEDSSSDSSDYSDDCDENDELVDVETVEEHSPSLLAAQMRKNVVWSRQRSSLCETDNSPEDNPRRKNHTVLERARRQEQRNLFRKLGMVLKCDPKSARLTILCRALDEIRNLKKESEALKHKKSMLAARQYLYLKRLSSLSGKSPAQIKNKLTEICERQKLKMSQMQLISRHVQSRAPQLLTTASQPRPEPSAPAKVGNGTSSQASMPMIPAHDKIRKILFMLKPHLHKTLTDSYGKTNAPPPASSASAPSPAGNAEPGEVLDSVKAGQQQTKADDKQEPSGETPEQKTSAAEIPKLLRSPSDETSNQASSSSIKPENKPQEAAPKPITLPLIRTKTGRIILPSCLKPLGNGFYTLMVMKSKGNDQVALTVRADVSKNPEKTPTESHQPGGSETSRVSEAKDTSSDLQDPKPSGASNPLSELAVLNQSLPAPAEDLTAQRKGSALLTDADMNQILAATRLTANQLPQNLNDASAERRAVSPRKSSEPETPSPLQPSRVKGQPGKTENKTPASAKRRGRPPKRRSDELLSPSGRVKRVGRPSKPKEDDPESSRRRFRSPQGDGGQHDASRPLTRAALGKDFPSAKKRSWIDMEKELESDVDAE
ncbi:uncharacterized protein mgab isoform X2 [Salarias fasciatus]|uniref:uncharacterized protein mgab isoform X2 n=1 Tax=Salarias fasciatus TaxID=181472 RepID=UPI001176ECC4|nr:uncharacterized protein LOC115402412 isoform X2 [Salarias fasciatus]